MKLVLEGWLADKRQTPVCVLQYFDFRECLGVGDGILLKEEAVVIRMALRPSLIKRRLPSAQLGSDSMLRRDRGTLYRPNMASDIKEIVDICEACQEMNHLSNIVMVTNQDRRLALISLKSLGNMNLIAAVN